MRLVAPLSGWLRAATTARMQAALDRGSTPTHRRSIRGTGNHRAPSANCRPVTVDQGSARVVGRESDLVDLVGGAPTARVSHQEVRDDGPCGAVAARSDVDPPQVHTIDGVPKRRVGLYPPGVLA